jgi:hypothetical protein
VEKHAGTRLFPLRELGELRTGFQLREAARHTEDGRYLLIQLGDVREDGVAPAMRMDLARARPHDLVRPGNLLLRSRGSSYRAAVVPAGLGDAVAIAPLYALRIEFGVALPMITPRKGDLPKIQPAGRPEAIPEYVAWWINLPQTQQLLASEARGSSMPTVGVQAFAELQIPLPPLALQKKVVETDRVLRQEQDLSARLQRQRKKLVSEALRQLVLGEPGEKATDR